MENDDKQKSIQPSSELDEFHYHEALDRSFLVASMIDELLLKHPVFEKHETLRESAEKAQELLAEVYQTIGYLELKKQIPNDEYTKKYEKKKVPHLKNAGFLL